MAPEENLNLLNQVIEAAQTIRIQQVQLAAENPEYKTNFGSIADEAWSNLNKASEQLWENLKNS